MKAELVRKAIAEIEQTTPGGETRVLLPSKADSFTKSFANNVRDHYARNGQKIQVRRIDHILIVRKAGA